ncbi:2-hydroxyacid dehydrogenase [Vreelandella nigrificans]|uniref:Hydroxyacid dehydrogenase n=1 Tax=Vreelandella nigrificans TaxID=2042704 RepID=A0A2A4HMB4_9GAMM|nr:2-hydroxyacid dehydrogenase [Halomonas nigrificans]PCF96488.1 hydroxyacid dehydrogenase [Halomonas nigrificans]
MPRILLTNHYSAGPLAFINKLVPTGFELIALEQPGQEEVIRKIPHADYLLVGGRTRIDRKVLGSASKLKMIQRSGVGLDSLDLDAIRERKLPLYVNEGVNARSVAEHTVMLMLATLRKVAIVNATTKNGEWVKHDVGINCHNLYGKQVGLIGLGNIGEQVAAMLKGFGVNLTYFKRKPLSFDKERELNIRYLPLQELLATSDIISLHCSLSTETTDLLSIDELARVKTGSVLINTARGGLVNETALLGALKSGHLAGAGLDVFTKEPLAAGHPFFEQDNLLLTPHIASITAETFADMMSRAFSNIALFDAGKEIKMTAKRVI